MVMISQEELEQKYLESRTELMKIPGVLWVGYGTKERAGELTKESALRVYVLEKKAINELAPEQVIPERINGLATDVLKIETSSPSASCQDLQSRSKVIGGISISNLKDLKQKIANQSGAAVTDEIGTLGCVAIIDGDTSKDHFALLTNNHVLAAKGGAVNDKVYLAQLKVRSDGGLEVALKLTSSQGNTPIQSLKLDNFQVFEIGKIMSNGMEGNFSYAYPGEQAEEYYIDCIAAKINTDFSSWCDTNKGVDFANEIRLLAVGGSNAIKRTGRLKVGDNGKKLIKVGRSTSRTVGELIDPKGAIVDSSNTITHRNVIFVKATEVNCDNVMRFSEKGDSGSAIITEDGEIVGLLFGDNDDSDLTKLRAHACHIHPACARLQVTPFTTEQNPLTARSNPAPQPGLQPSPQPGSQPGAQPAPEPVVQPGFQPGMARAGNAFPRTVQERLSGSPRGRGFLELVERHRPELVHLVNRVRPVLVTWHRSKGAAYLTHFINSFRDPEYIVPAEIEGISLKTSVMRMAEALRAHGSRELVQSVDQHVNEALGLADRVRKTEDLFAHLTNA